MVTFHVSCPKCGEEDTIELAPEEMDEEYGITRIGLIHRGHVLIVDIDAHMFVRGAYLTSLPRVFPNVKLFFKDYRVTIHPVIKSDSQLAIIHDGEKHIDIRAFYKYFLRIYEILSTALEVMSRNAKYGWYRGDISIFDTTFDIALGKGVMLLLKTNIRSWDQRTQILRRIHSIILREGIPNEEVLREIVLSINK